MRKKAAIVLIAVCAISVISNIVLLVRLYDVKTKSVYEEELTVSIVSAQRQAQDYLQNPSAMAYQYLVGDLCVIQRMASSLQSRDYDAVRRLYDLCVTRPAFIQEHMDDLIEILNIMEGSYTHPDISNRIDRLRNEAENGG